jgi:hypothetical protein
VDDGDRRRLEGRRQVLRDASRLGGVVGKHAVEHAAVGYDGRQLDVRRRGADHDQPLLLEGGQHGPGLTRERRAHEAEDVLVADVIVEDGRRLGGIALRVELFEGDVELGVRLVELLDRDTGAVSDVDAEVGGVTRERADERDGELGAFAVAAARGGRVGRTSCRRGGGRAGVVVVAARGDEERETGERRCRPDQASLAHTWLASV